MPEIRKRLEILNVKAVSGYGHLGINSELLLSEQLTYNFY